MLLIGHSILYYDEFSSGFLRLLQTELISVLFIILSQIKLVKYLSYNSNDFPLFLYSLGHHFGPISPEMNKTLKECDDYVGQLLNLIDQHDDLKNNLNVIITSDHGMHEIDKTHKIRLEDYIDKSLFSAYGARSFVNIFVKNGRFLL